MRSEAINHRWVWELTGFHSSYDGTRWIQVTETRFLEIENRSNNSVERHVVRERAANDSSKRANEVHVPVDCNEVGCSPPPMKWFAVVALQRATSHKVHVVRIMKVYLKPNDHEHVIPKRKTADFTPAPAWYCVTSSTAAPTHNNAAQAPSSHSRDPEENVVSPARPVGERDKVVASVSQPRTTENRESGSELCDGHKQGQFNVWRHPHGRETCDGRKIQIVILASS